MVRGASGRPATITVVAKQAGVSISTVSRVMNGNEHVDPAIAERVRAVASELRYSASPLARSLVLGRTQRVAILLPDVENPTFQSVLPADKLRVLLPELAPVVLINRESPYVPVPTLTADYEAGIQPLARHLYQLGHRRIAYLEGNPDSVSNTQRRTGLARFRAEHPDADVLGIPCGVTFERGHAVADAVLASGATGVLGFNDLVAMGLSWARRRGSGCARCSTGTSRTTTSASVPASRPVAAQVPSPALDAPSRRARLAGRRRGQADCSAEPFSSLR